MSGSSLMVQGTASHAGKSLLAAALCRIYARRGLSVAPFKAQNMSNNAAVCPDGAEIGRAQALQARAAGIPPSADMNPVLLKPTSGRGCQVVVMGKARGYRKALAYERTKRRHWPLVAAAAGRLRAAHDLLVVEGAGSPAEINLRAREIVNMRVARHLGCPVLLVADIDRGGAFAAVVGTLALLPPRDRARVRGWVLNKFRGEARLLAGAIRVTERRTGKPCVGVIPFLAGHGLEEEDSLGLEGRPAPARPLSARIAVVGYPHIANYTDLQALERDGAEVRYVSSPGGLRGADAVVLPGSRHTRFDLAWLRGRGFEGALRGFRGVVVGICGGFQMLGERLEDPLGSDGGRPGTDRGLGLLPVKTLFSRVKQTHAVTARPTPALRFAPSSRRLDGYEIHLGETLRLDGVPAAFRLFRPDGTSLEDGAVAGAAWGTYLHGLFDAAPFRRAFLRDLCRRRGRPAPRFPRLGADPLDRWADHVAAHLDLGRIDAWLGLGGARARA